MTGSGVARYDVFLSLGGNDRDQGRHLAARLREHGLRVFVDEDDIGYFGGITGQIEQALRSSKTFVAYYSRTYPERPSCQLELTAAFLAGQAEGDPTRRILVINPEPDDDHLFPAELSDARYMSASVAVSDQVRLICDRVAAVAGVIGDVNLRRRPRRHYGKIAGAVGFVGRYREQWAIHSALFAADLPLSQEKSSGPVVCVAGLPGAGKTSLVSAYAWNFGSAFDRGVYWTRLAGKGREALASYDRQLLDIAQFLGLDIGSGNRHRVLGAVADHLAAEKGSALWIVDDVSGVLAPSIVHDLVLPAGPGVRTVLISDQRHLAELVPVIGIGGLASSDAAGLLDSWRPTRGPSDRLARDRLIDLVGGHAGALSDIGRAIRDSHGIISYEQAVTQRSSVMDTIDVAGVFRSTIAELTAPQRLVLQLALRLNGAPVPAPMVAAEVERLGLVDENHDPALTAAIALGDLRDRFLAERTDTAWSIHPLALRMARRHIDEQISPHPLREGSVKVGLCWPGGGFRAV
ncbi:tetratricopeptide repeat protein [Actinocrispum wychmicini]|uniref:TIR domain-containing protein n=1 Tax=Actinocrispum wychmicini TaxID=1213861 RepID=A0A4R2K068_9PSEU|nr:TIR domain-containing protein [Actinocrispum wychmicini]TCO64982.1 TIR domain-containing protein [Actinocrispum wychmicini]